MCTIQRKGKCGSLSAPSKCRRKKVLAVRRQIQVCDPSTMPITGCASCARQQHALLLYQSACVMSSMPKADVICPLGQSLVVSVHVVECRLTQRGCDGLLLICRKKRKSRGCRSQRNAGNALEACTNAMC